VYEVLLEQTAERDLRRLPAVDFQRLISRIKALADNPRPSGCRKITGAKNYWRIRVGTYRVIYEIDEKGKVVKVMRIRHRREAYR
jgi:mRNA interferase RelE/StbE